MQDSNITCSVQVVGILFRTAHKIPGNLFESTETVPRTVSSGLREQNMRSQGAILFSRRRRDSVTNKFLSEIFRDPGSLVAKPHRSAFRIPTVRKTICVLVSANKICAHKALFCSRGDAGIRTLHVQYPDWIFCS